MARTSIAAQRRAGRIPPYPDTQERRRSLRLNPPAPASSPSGNQSNTLTPQSSSQTHIDHALPTPSRACTRLEKRHWHNLLVATMASNLPTFVFLIGSPFQESAAAITARVTALVSSHPELPPPVKQCDYVSWVVTIASDPKIPSDIPIPAELLGAVKARKAACKARRSQRRRCNMMLFTPTHYGHLTMTMVDFYLEALPDGEEYPPRGEWVAESEELYSRWARYLATMKLPDKRRRRSPTHLLDRSKLQYDMPADLNFQIFDKTTKQLVFRMVRNFCPNQDFVKYGRDVVYEAVTTKKSIRLEDRGVIVQIGFTAGSRSAPEFGWARNSLSKKTDEGASNRQVSTLMTGFWLMSKQAFPPEVVEDFENFYGECGVPRLDPEWPRCNGAPRGRLEFPQSCGEFKWDHVDLAPGCGVMVQRYARAVHHEHQGHDWALNWTTLREGSHPQGGNFVLAKYGVLIRLSANSAFAWRPAHWHATTLALFDPKDDSPHRDHPTYNQQCVAFVTSPRIGTTYEKWRDANEDIGSVALEGHLAGAGGEIYA